MKNFTFVILLLMTFGVQGQLEHPKASPAAKVVQAIGFSSIQIDYSRPATRGREIFGELVPYGRIWRVGANESTKFTNTTEIDVLGHTLHAGTYALYAFPQESEWEIVFHKNTKHWGDGRNNYNQEEDAFRVKVIPNSEASFQENFQISFENISHNGTDMIFHWAKTRVVIPIKVDTQGTMETQIEKALQPRPSAQTYYEVARYYVEQKIKYAEALDYLNKALELGGDTYYFHRVKSLAEAALNDHKAAINSAKKSLAIAKELGKDEFVRMNQKNIDLWLSQLKN